ncbi:MAG: DUF799 family lipoprotein, partial [Syntrophales bacterium]|nr:DUF799 family lipoprotein [Syntrophales bacterium]
IPLSFIDDRLAAMADGTDVHNMPPRTAGEALGVDAVVYSKLTEWSTSQRLLYGSTEIAASFELICAKTGEVLWRRSHDTKDRHFDITRGRLEGKANIAYDEALREVLDEVMSSFPEGPEYLKVAPPYRNPWYLRWLRR